MRAVVQRVNHAQVTVGDECVGRIERGLCVLVGVMAGDEELAAKALVRKISALRIFPDSNGKMNLSVKDVGGEVLAVSQFTLAGDVRKGNRPAFTSAMAPDEARPLFERFCVLLRETGLEVQTGRFQTEMRVLLENDGPVTLLLDTERAF